MPDGKRLIKNTLLSLTDFNIKNENLAMFIAFGYFDHTSMFTEKNYASF